MKLKRQVFSYPYIVWMLIFILVPMLLIVLFAFRSDEGLTLGNITSVLSNEIYMEVLGRSIWIALKATAICLILGYPIAYILSTMNKRKAAILYVLFIVPMWMNFLLRTYAWQVLLDSNGVLNTLLELLGLPSQQILYTEGAVMLGTVYNFLPFMVLPIYSVLVKLDRSLVEAAADLGANPITCFVKVVLPQSVPGIISGITMVFIPAITTFPPAGRRQIPALRRSHREPVHNSGPVRMARRQRAQLYSAYSGTSLHGGHAPCGA